MSTTTDSDGSSVRVEPGPPSVDLRLRDPRLRDTRRSTIPGSLHSGISPNVTEIHVSTFSDRRPCATPACACLRAYQPTPPELALHRLGAPLRTWGRVWRKAAGGSTIKSVIETPEGDRHRQTDRQTDRAHHAMGDYGGRHPNRLRPPPAGGGGGGRRHRHRCRPPVDTVKTDTVKSGSTMGVGITTSQVKTHDIVGGPRHGRRPVDLS
jgi:hypothetical protein